MKNIFILAMFLFSFTSWAQEGMFTLSGGYAFANIEEVETNASGFRINGVYEYNPLQGPVAHGLSIGYIGTKADFAGNGDTNYKLNTWPVYYAPKYMFGEQSVKGFVKGAIGMQLTSLKRTGTLGDLKTSSIGFYGGIGAGVMKSFNDKVFANLEYEWAYLSNDYYRNGIMNSLTLGIGVHF